MPKAACMLRYVTYSYTKMPPDAVSSQTGSGNASVMGDFESSNPTSYSTLVHYPTTTVSTLENNLRFGINWKYKYPMPDDV